jgi:hypothetical protein
MQAWHIPDAVCAVFELLMMGGETAWNMSSIDSNKEYCITLHLYTKKNTLMMHRPMNVKRRIVPLERHGNGSGRLYNSRNTTKTALLMGCKWNRMWTQRWL